MQRSNWHVLGREKAYMNLTQLEGKVCCWSSYYDVLIDRPLLREQLVRDRKPALEHILKLC